MRTVLQCMALVALLAVAAPAAEPETHDDFKGPILLVIDRSTTDKYIAITGAGVKRLGDRPFLVGKALGGTEPWKKNRRVWLPLSEVGEIIEFDSEDELKDLFGL